MTVHTIISYLKSAIRMVGFVVLMYGHLPLAGLVLFSAEVLGIIEELPGAYKGTKTS